MAQTCQICGLLYEALADVQYIMHGRVFFGLVCTKCRTCEKCTELLEVTYNAKLAQASIKCKCGTETFDV